MNKRNVRFVVGYFVGGLLVLVLIPWGLYRASVRWDQLLPFQLMPNLTLRITLAGILFMTGMFFGIWSIIVQNTRGAGGPVQFLNTDISPRTQKLVVSGPYRYSRNPMLFGACLAYFGVAVLLNSPVALILVVLFMSLMLVFVKRTEEPRLLRDFGSEYEDYRRQVSLFIPWMRKKGTPPNRQANGK